MRRIPRPQRAIDPTLSGTSLLRAQIPPPSCRRAIASPLLRTTSASFSTTPAFSFLISGKPDKRKHLHQVRRWQKRLLGDSEPIGSHVDPYDPTSPVRIAPEEQGEEVEVLEDGTEGVDMNAVYEEESDAKRLKHVGGPKWVERLEEGKLAKEFEKLTMRTYTPLTKRMADQIEDLTGSMYTLRDENLMMGQEFEDATNKPYTNWSFGPSTRLRDLPKIRRSFHQAVVEVYALKEAGKNLDVSAAPNRGVYTAPQWIQDVKLQKTSNGEFALAFPASHTVEAFLETMEKVPDYTPEQPLADEELISEEIVAEEPTPQMDPDTPAFKKAAVVKQDPDMKPFDFMSNRPVPRKVSPPPAEPVAETVVQPQGPGTTEATSSRLSELEKAASLAEKEVASLRSTVTALAKKKTTRVEGTKTEAQAQAEAEADAEAKWRHVPLEDINIKFALTKRLNQLTGLYISDPNLTSASTLGDLYHYFCAASKPKSTHLFTQIHVLGQRQAEAAKKRSAQTADESRQKPNLSTLLKLNNVEIHRERPNVTYERRKKGLQKVIQRELLKRELIPARPTNRKIRKEREIQEKLMKKERKMVEGTRTAPEFGVPVSPTAALVLKQRTERKKKSLLERDVPEGGVGLALGDIEGAIRRRKMVE